jgi:acyl-coenzyme A thioesterase PaaI-like protein
MTDLPIETASLPARLGATARIDGGELVIALEPHPAVLREGVVRASVLSYVVDCVAGIQLDLGSEAWTLTTDMTVRALPVPAPSKVDGRFRLLREGRRSATGVVDLITDDGARLGSGAIGFTRVERRDGDPPKHDFTLEELVEHFASMGVITEPLPDAARIEVIDAADGVVEVPLTNALRNTAGTLQGAMTALIAEVAAEEALSARAGGPVVVTDLDVRYLSRTATGPVRTRCAVLGDGAAACATVELVDLSKDAITALVYARGTTIC